MLECTRLISSFLLYHYHCIKKQFRTVVRLHHYSIRTEKSYWYWVRNFIFFNQLLHPQKTRCRRGQCLSHLACLFLQARLPPLGFSPQSAAVNLRDHNNRCHGVPERLIVIRVS
ncbi:phage integrase N-terminal SAM-like domain-containing protein [Aeromonas salmonicida]|uniref:phage integrase N-terminal SAM-like domain-containing protein n=1 Tax=Aeromonas salmonicida TaxID=645 RepID=UPI001BAEC951